MTSHAVGKPHRARPGGQSAALQGGIRRAAPALWHLCPADQLPTVPRGTERLRLTPTPLQSDEHIYRLVTALTEIWNMARKKVAERSSASDRA